MASGLSGPVSHNSYRPEIDGLRAIAVLAVMGYHAFPKYVPGGFAGVDVFFVISGYLITLVILNDLRRESFTLSGFYGRRVRRIFPALVLVLVAVLFLGWFALLESQFRYVGKHIAAGAIFSSNLLLWRETGYFDWDRDTKPLLHLWSLAIEEQFYIVWPVLIVIAWKKRINLFSVMLLAFVISFGINIGVVAFRPVPTFYLPVTRGWELALGGLLSVLQTVHRPNINVPLGIMRPLLAAAGIVGVMASFFLLNIRHPYPGFRALLPTSAAAFIIWAGSDAWPNRAILSNRLLVGCGLISFPLYLWHWPLLSITQLIQGGLPETSVREVILLGSAVLAFLSYRFVERPMRFGKRLRLKTVLLCSLMVVVGTAGWAAARGRIRSMSDAYGTGKIEAAMQDWDFPGTQLQGFQFAGRTFHRTSAPGNGQVVVYFGDSQTMEYAPRISSLVASAPASYPRAVFLTQPGCPPSRNIVNVQSDSACAGFFEKAMAYLKTPEITAVVVSAAWPWYLSQNFYYRGNADPYNDLREMLAGFCSTGKRVYLVLPQPGGPLLAPESMVSRHFSLIPWQFELRITGQFVPNPEVNDYPGSLRKRLKEAALEAGAEIIDPIKYLCGKSTCRSADDDGEPRYFDQSHLRAKFVREHVTYLDRTLTDSSVR